jgi:hypothetical protein
MILAEDARRGQQFGLRLIFELGQLALKFCL